MTTINNSQLIEKVGGIERARGIIAGAPSNAVIYWPIAKGKFGVYSAGEQNKSDRQIILDDLRTAIAENDLKQCQHGYDIACLICGFGNENGVRVWRNQIESDDVTDIRNHVSPSTIIKDLEAERHG